MGKHLMVWSKDSLGGFVGNLFIAWSYAGFCLVLNLSEFKNFFLDQKVYSSFSLYDTLIRTVVVKDLLWYGLAFLIVYSTLALFCSIVAMAVSGSFPFDSRIKKLLSHLFLVAVLYLLFVENALVFPHTTMYQPSTTGILFFSGLKVIVFAALLFAAVKMGFCLFRRPGSGWLIQSLFLLLSVIVVFLLAHPAAKSVVKYGAGPLPNIIIIGIDSLRPDILQISKKDDIHHVTTKNIDAFLKGAVFFKNSYTPFARTFPAWVSILTGKYPVHHGARFNLTNPDQLNKNNHYIPEYLKKKGYYTLYGSDEKRFCNIDETYGFDAVFGPEAGAADFLIAPIAKTPLINFIVNTRLGSFLFPYNHGNRAVGSTYQPETFTGCFKRTMEQLPGRPVFLAIHLCLPHWPYDWADSVKGDNDNYLGAVSRVDAQFNEIMAILNQGFLDNALVVLLSDHGESLGSLNEREKFTSEIDKQAFNITRNGHGTFVPDRSQFRVVLGIRRFGKETRAVTVDSDVSLVDIAPTLLDFAGVDYEKKLFDGISLGDWLSGDRPSKSVDRILFMESGYDGGITFTGKNVTRLISSGIDKYEITPTGKIAMKKSAVKELMETKQYLALSKDRSVAVIPEENNLKVIGIDYTHGTWRKIESEDGGGGSCNGVPSGVYGALLKALFVYHKNDAVVKKSNKLWDFY